MGVVEAVKPFQPHPRSIFKEVCKETPTLRTYQNGGVLEYYSCWRVQFSVLKINGMKIVYPEVVVI